MGYHYISSYGAWPGAKILNSIDVVLLPDEQLRVVDPEVVEPWDGQYIEAVQRIWIDNAARLIFLSNNWHQRFAFRVGKELCAYLSASCEDSQNRHFPFGSTTPLIITFASEGAFSDFTFAKVHSFIGFFFRYDTSEPSKQSGFL